MIQEETIFTRYNVDVAHTRHVADLALTLFDTLYDAYDLPSKTRDLIEIGALLHDVGLSTDEARHHIVGRDIVLSSDVTGMDEDKRAIVACMVAFHRKKVRPESEPSYLRLGKKQRRIALHLAALLRIADGLDYSHTQSTRISTCTVKNDEVVLHIYGPNAEQDGKRAMQKADLWRKTLNGKIRVARKSNDTTPATPSSDSDAAPAAASDIPLHGNGVQPDTQVQELAVPAVDETRWVEVVQPPSDDHALAEMGRRLMRYHVQKLLTRERDARADKDIEAVHEMRVATRRLRALLPVMEFVAPPEQARYFRKGLRRIARSLAGVRDCDVFLQQVQHYQAALPKDEQKALKPLPDAILRERESARAHMLIELDSRRYEQFKREFAVFMTDTAEEWNTDMRVCDVAGSMIWKRYEELRAFESRIDMDNLVENDDVALHNARIAGKRLRYVLELFSENLADRVKPALEPLLKLQECLGIIQDIAVAKAFVATISAEGAEKAALDAYDAARDAERLQELAKFPGLWRSMMGNTYRRSLMEFIIRL